MRLLARSMLSSALTDVYKRQAEYQLFAGGGVQLHLGVGDDIADVAQQQDGLAVLAVIKLFAALERVFGIVCQARLVDEQGGIRVLREDAEMCIRDSRICFMVRIPIAIFCIEQRDI